MGNPLHLVKDSAEAEPETEPSNSTGVSEHRDISDVSDVRSSLIQSLSKVADEQEIKEVIQLLEDIRSYQEHPKMRQAFAENSHKLADGVKDYDNDILELLLDDYLRKHELTSDMLQGDRHESEFQGHVQYFVINALRGYQEAVENIRNESQDKTNSVPFKPIDPEHPYELKRKLDRPAYGTSAYNICQVLRAARANNKTDSPLFERIIDNGDLQEIMTKFGGETKNLSQAIVDAYQSEERVAGNFEDYLTELLAKIQHSCDNDLYQKLLHWSPRQTIPATLAPPSMRVSSITLIPENSNKSVLKADSQPSVYKDTTYTISTGCLTTIAYAMKNSTIEVEDDAKLNLFMADDNVTIKLKGDRSSVKIDRVMRTCKSLRIRGKGGELLRSGSNLELSDEVVEKLKT